MPQNKPMTPEAVIQSIDDNYAPLSIDAKISIDDLLAQLIRSTLEAAAERVKAKRITVTAATWNDALDEAEADIIEPIAQKVEI